MIRFILIKHGLPLEENIGLINPDFARILVDNNLDNKTILQQTLAITYDYLNCNNCISKSKQEPYADRLKINSK
ncbi:hypothetical protein A0O36_02764 [Piscirickettsiaceae bacterium NZ-RLO1]|nr:hypothetical protein A0O36_02764 [Piscirickettsiaceae bacterium NZ-RLO1]